MRKVFAVAATGVAIMLVGACGGGNNSAGAGATSVEATSKEAICKSAQHLEYLMTMETASLVESDGGGIPTSRYGDAAKVLSASAADFEAEAERSGDAELASAIKTYAGVLREAASTYENGSQDLHWLVADREWSSLCP